MARLEATYTSFWLVPIKSNQTMIPSGGQLTIFCGQKIDVLFQKGLGE